MGSLFSAPTPPPPPPPAVLPQPDPEAEARRERLRALLRRRRGLAGLVETGPRGLGAPAPGTTLGGGPGQTQLGG